MKDDNGSVSTPTPVNTVLKNSPAIRRLRETASPIPKDEPIGKGSTDPQKGSCMKPKL